MINETMPVAAPFDAVTSPVTAVLDARPNGRSYTDR